VGLAAIQIAKHMGAHVIAQTSSAAKRETLLAFGAHEVIVSDGTFSEPKVNVALELTGAATFGSSLRCLEPRGRIVVVGNITLERVNLNLGAVILYSQRILGSRSYSAKDLDDVFALVRSGQLKPTVDRTLALDEAKEAHRLLEARAVKGRVILVP
jgi:NADPH:quinone reductase-like Zn-dependent oxidoreductase